MKKKEVGREILKLLENVALSSAAVCGAMITSGYGAPLGKLEGNADRIRESLEDSFSSDLLKLKKQNIYSLLYKLKKDGLIEKKQNGWIITKQGKLKLNNKKFPNRSYKKIENNTLTILIFDIPEKFSNKRRWLRSQLVALGFKLLQHSVWIGRVRLPVEFVQDLKDLDMLDYIEIMIVNKSGSLKKKFLN